MLGPRWRKVVRELWEHKTRTVLVVLSIAVGVFAVGMIAGTQVALSDDLTAVYRSTNPASAILYVQPFDDDLVQTVKGMKDVREAEGRRAVTVRVAVGPDEWKTLRLFAIPDYTDIRTNKFWSERGAWPPPNHGVLIERASSDFIGTDIGSSVLVKTPSGKERELRVAGLTHDIDQMPAFFSGRAYGYITFDTLEWLEQPRNYNELHIIVAGDTTDKAHIRSVVDEVKSKIEKGGLQVYGRYIPEPGKHPADNAIQAMLLLLGVLGSLALLLSGFLVVNTISALLMQQVRQIGVMKAVGGRNSQITGIYLGVVLIYSFLSLVLGVPLGILGAYGLTNFAAGLLNFDLASFSITPQVLALEVTVGVMVPIIASLVPVISGTHITVREALSTYGLGKGQVGSSFIDRLIDRVSAIFWMLPRPLLLSLRNTFRRKGRLALTLVTLTLGGAIFIGVFCVRASTTRTLNDALDYWKYDVEIGFALPHRVEQIQHEALSVPGVVKAESWGSGSATRIRADDSESAGIYLIAPPAETSLLKPIVLQGRWLLPEDENALVVNTDLLRNEPDIKTGDEIVLRIENRDTTWRIVGIVRGVLSGPVVYANYPYYSRVVRDVGRATNVMVETAQHDAAFESQVAKALEDQFTNSGLRVSSRGITADERDMAQSQFNLIVVFLLIMAVLLAVVGGLGLMGTMSINVLERTREIGVMRAVGASDAAVLMVFMAEGVLIGLISWLIGAVLAVPLSKLLSDAVGDAFVRAPLSYAFSMGGTLLWLAIVVILAATASFLPSWNASRLSVREILAYE